VYEYRRKLWNAVSIALEGVMPSNRNVSQVVLSLVSGSFSQLLSIIYTLSCYSIVNRGVLIAREEWLMAHTEIPAAVIAAVIAAVFQFTNALRFFDRSRSIQDSLITHTPSKPYSSTPSYPIIFGGYQTRISHQNGSLIMHNPS
jgi:hypothetical protein